MSIFGRNGMMRARWLGALLALCLAPFSHATVYELPTDGSSVVGEDSHIKTVYKDTLLDIARRNSLGYYEIIRANPSVDMWLPGEGTDVMLPGRRILPPGPREGIVVNLPEHRLYYYPKPKKGEKPVVITYPVSIGKMDWKTPIGETRVIQKEKHPVWYPPEGVRKEHLANGDPIPAVVKPGPDNPLGDYAMRLAAGNGTYLIHGTNNPMAVGMAITHGCIRMYPEDVAALFPLIPVGTKVWLINEPVKVAFVDGELLMEAHPPVDDEGQNTADPDMQLLSQKLDQALGNVTAAIHWDFARQALQAANGIPTVVGLQADMDPTQAAAAIESGSTPDSTMPAVSGSSTPSATGAGGASTAAGAGAGAGATTGAAAVAAGSGTSAGASAAAVTGTSVGASAAAVPGTSVGASAAAVPGTTVGASAAAGSGTSAGASAAAVPSTSAGAGAAKVSGGSAGSGTAANGAPASGAAGSGGKEPAGTTPAARAVPGPAADHGLPEKQSQDSSPKDTGSSNPAAQASPPDAQAVPPTAAVAPR